MFHFSLTICIVGEFYFVVTLFLRSFQFQIVLPFVGLYISERIDSSLCEFDLCLQKYRDIAARLVSDTFDRMYAFYIKQKRISYFYIYFFFPGNHNEEIAAERVKRDVTSGDGGKLYLISFYCMIISFRISQSMLLVNYFSLITYTLKSFVKYVSSAHTCFNLSISYSLGTFFNFSIFTLTEISGVFIS